jgi:hypothetical protein
MISLTPQPLSRRERGDGGCGWKLFDFLRDKKEDTTDSHDLFLIRSIDSQMPLTTYLSPLSPLERG